jgi:hypothetical protein
MSEKSSKTGSPQLHQGFDSSAPYPVSRLAPAFNLVELAEQVEKADEMLAGQVNVQLEQIAQQIKFLQEQARGILTQAQENMQLHRAKCQFKKIPGKTYHLYRTPEGASQFSMLSPDDWKGNPPNEYLGAYCMGSDMRWAPADQARQSIDPDVLRLLTLD